MQSASKLATAFAEQLQALAALSVVQGDETLTRSFGALEGYVLSYGTTVAETCGGLSSIVTGSVMHTDWKPVSHPMMQQSSRIMTEAAAELATRLRALTIPARPPRAPAWAEVKDGVVQGARTAAGTAFTGVRAALGVGLKAALQGKNPGTVLLDTIGRDRIAGAIETARGKARDPVGTLQQAGDALLPKLQRGLDLGRNLGTELATAVAEIIPTDGVEPVTEEFVDALRFDVRDAEFSVLKESAEAIERTAANLARIGEADVNRAAADAIDVYLGRAQPAPVAPRSRKRAAAGTGTRRRRPRGE
jgi:hypothetical protein